MVPVPSTILSNSMELKTGLAKCFHTPKLDAHHLFLIFFTPPHLYISDKVKFIFRIQRSFCHPFLIIVVCYSCLYDIYPKYSPYLNL